MQSPHPIPALVPQLGSGHQFVCYADSCSGVAGAPHEATFAAMNAVVARLRPQPQFICFPGDEIAGLTSDDDALRAQWKYWLDHEMAWLDRKAAPLYHTTGNHTTYDRASEDVFREVLAHLPRNGPPKHEGLAYFVRRDDLLLIFCDTASSVLGGEGRVETEWLDRTLADHADAKHKLVFGHHPVFSVNGFGGAFQRDIERENGKVFWNVLVRHRVLAYLCSHILAFDVQVHEGVLQIVTAGAGTAHRMPAEHEYLHCVQAALDDRGLRYQVLDASGHIREWLQWPPEIPDSSGWIALASDGSLEPGSSSGGHSAWTARLVAFRVAGLLPPSGDASPQTLLCALETAGALPRLWIGLTGSENRLTVLLAPAAGRSPHHWYGPAFSAGERFDVQIALHTGMGPGGILWRYGDRAPWSSLGASSPWGAERLSWPISFSIGHDQRGPSGRPFRRRDLEVRQHAQSLRLDGWNCPGPAD